MEEEGELAVAVQDVSSGLDYTVKERAMCKG